jgi:hypothetical protein
LKITLSHSGEESTQPPFSNFVTVTVTVSVSFGAEGTPIVVGTIAKPVGSVFVAEVASEDDVCSGGACGFREDGECVAFGITVVKMTVGCSWAGGVSTGVWVVDEVGGVLLITTEIWGVGSGSGTGLGGGTSVLEVVERMEVIVVLGRIVVIDVGVPVEDGTPDELWAPPVLIPRMLPAAVASVHPTYTPLVVFMGIAKHISPDPQTIITKFPAVLQFPTFPEMHAISPESHGEEKFKVAKREL